VKREHLDSTNLQSDTSYEYDTDDFESSIQLTFDTSRDGDDDGDNNEDGEATANDDDKAKDTTKAADEFQFVDNVDDVDWKHLLYTELYTGLYMEKLTTIALIIIVVMVIVQIINSKYMQTMLQ